MKCSCVGLVSQVNRRKSNGINSVSRVCVAIGNEESLFTGAEQTRASVYLGRPGTITLEEPVSPSNE